MNKEQLYRVVRSYPAYGQLPAKTLASDPLPYAAAMEDFADGIAERNLVDLTLIFNPHDGCRLKVVAA